MALRDLLQAGSNSYVAWLLEHGYSLASIRAKLESRHANEAANTYWAAVQRGQAAHAAGQAFGGLGPSQALPNPQFAQAVGKQGGYRYYVLAMLRDQATGNEVERPLIVSSGHSLTPIEINTLAQTQANVQYGPTAPLKRNSPRMGLFDVTGLQVLAAERIQL